MATFHPYSIPITYKYICNQVRRIESNLKLIYFARRIIIFSAYSPNISLQCICRISKKFTSFHSSYSHKNRQLHVWRVRIFHYNIKVSRNFIQNASIYRNLAAAIDLYVSVYMRKMTTKVSPLGHASVTKYNHLWVDWIFVYGISQEN